MGLQPVQAQAFLTYGNGVVIGNTSMTLTNFLDINGNQLTMSNFGTVGTFTIEPNAGSQEEQCIFTGVTQNSNGTATLTGISSVGFESPYTQTSGFLKNHAGGVTVALSDTAYLYSQYANTGLANTFTATQTFNISPLIPTVASSATTQAASVGYVNAISIAGAPKASNTVFGITELSVAPVTASVPIAVGQNDPNMPTTSEALALAGDGGTPSNTNTYVTQTGSQIGTESFAVTTGGSVAFAISLTPTPAGYVTGERIYFKTNVASGTAPTINKNSLGAKSLYKLSSSGTTPLAIGDLGTNQMCVAEYDGGAYQVLNPTANDIPIYTKGFGSSSSATVDGAAHTVSTDCFIIGTASSNGNSSTTGCTAATSGTTLTMFGNSTNGVIWNIPFCLPIKSGNSYTLTNGTNSSISAQIITIT